MFRATTAPQDPLILQLLPIVTQACEILRAEYRHYCAGDSFAIERKADDSPVTQADFKVNQYLTQALAELFDIPLLSEEGEQQRQNWPRFWLLDPLDGTKEFLHQRPQFTINLSLVEKQHTIFALLAVPEEEVIYLCPPHQGLPLKYEAKTQQWSIFNYPQSTSPVYVGISQSGQQKQQYQAYLAALEQYTAFELVKSGSAYKFCLMLEDQIDIYPRFHPTYEWDTSAGQCLIERIGGGLIDFQGRPFIYNQRDSVLNGGFLAYRNLEMKKLALQALGRMSNMH